MTMLESALGRKQRVTSEIANLKKMWTTRNQAFAKAYEMREMRDRFASMGELSIALNDARVLLDLTIHMLSHKLPLLKVPVLGVDAAQQESSGEAETWLRGVHYAIDFDHFNADEAFYLRGTADYLATTGWWAQRDFVAKNADGTPQFVSDVLDPAGVWPNFGTKRLEAVVHSYRTNLADLRSKAALFGWNGNWMGDGTIAADIEDYWWMENDEIWNAVTVVAPGKNQNERLFAVDPIRRDIADQGDFDFIPIKTGSANGWATRSKQMGSNRDPATWRGEGVLAAGVPIFDMANRWATMTLRKAHQSIEPTVLLRSRAGRWTVGEKDLRAGVGIPVAQDQSIEMVERPDLKPEVAGVVMPMLQRGIERAGASDVLLGNIDTNDLAGAGYALSLAEPRVMSRVMPFALVMQFVGQSRDRMYLEEYRTKEYAPVKLLSKGENAREARQIYFREWKPDELPEHSTVFWELQLSMPDRLPLAIATARQARPSGNLLDEDTTLEDVLKVRDPAAVKRRKELEEVKLDPSIMALRAITQMEEYAEQLRDDADGYERQGDTRQANLLRRQVVRVEEVIASRVQSLQTGRPQAATPGLQPEFFGVQGAQNGQQPLLR